MTDVIMPQMGESIAEGTVTKWMKAVGDRVERDEPLFEISTDKVDAEIPSPASGVLREIRVQPGETVAINTVVGVIVPEGEAEPATPPPAEEPPLAAGPETPPIEVVPAVAPSPTAAPPVDPGPPVPSRPSPAVDAPSPAADQTSRPAQAALPAEDTTVVLPRTKPPAPAAAPALLAAPQGTASESPRGEPEAPQVPEKAREEMSAEELRQTRSSPVVRRIAAEHQVDLRGVSGSGISGRVTKQDILAHIESLRPQDEAAQAPPSVAEARPSPAQPAYRPGERVEIVPMSPIRRKTAEHMVLSRRVSAHVSTVWEVDMSRVSRLRERHAGAYEERSGVKLTYLPFIVKAVIDALKAFPILNSSVDGDSIVYRKDVHLGVAVSMDRGLIVPVIRNADEKNLLGIAKAIGDLAERARTKRLTVDEVQGGTFTITNAGVFGSLFGTPIINQPQVAILAIGAVEKRPVVRDDAIAIREMAYFALTFDHRIVDGSDADRFMGHFKKGLQDFDEASL
jgi:2-oxoglutarate dehydrogenase E2 component (dihydrolipoamide succinyltransferase)